MASLLPVFAVATARPAGAAAPASIGIDHDQDGTSWYPDQTALTPQLVQGGTFGQQFSTQLQGDIQAQSLVDNGTLLVETEADMAYGLDPASGTIQWSKSLGTPFSSAAIGCSDLPGVGVTGTPVVDTSTNIEYFLAKSYINGASGAAQYQLHALSVATGQEQPNFPVTIGGTASDDPNQTFNATYQLQRPGLVLMGGVVYAAFGSHCDLPPTNGWIVGVSTAGAQTTLWSDEAGIDTGDGLGGIWSPGALRSDGPGQLIFATGNGYGPTQPTAGHASPAPAQLAESVVRVAVQPDGSLKTTDFFTPSDAAALNQIDGDLGAGAPVILPSSFSTPQYPELAVEMGKEGYLYVLDASNLGGYKQGADEGDAVLARLGPVQGVWGTPAVWGGDGGYLYTVTNGGSADGAPGATDGKLLAWKFGVDGSGKPTFALVGSSADAFGYSSSSPVVTSSGSTSGTSILWVNWADGPGSTTAQLRAYGTVPDASGTLPLLWSGPSGASVKLSQPGVAGNRIYVGGFDGVIRGFGAPTQSPLAGGSLQFPQTTVGQSTTATETFTATTAVTVSAIAASAGSFSLGTTTPALPVTLAAGQTLTVPVTFTPTRYGIIGGTVTLTTSAGPYQVGLSGNGLSATALLVAAPQTISFAGTPTGGSTTQDAVFTNDGSQSLTITGTTLPAVPYTVGGLPATGTSLAPGASVSVSITFAPTTTGSYLDSLTLASDTGGSASVALSATAGTPAQLQVTPAALSYGTVAVGHSVTESFVVANVGGTALTINKSKAPGLGEFSASTQLPEGTVLQPGASDTETVTFTPTAAGTFTDSWPINGDGNSVLTAVTFTGIGTTTYAPLSTWSMKGNAAMSGSSVALTSTTSKAQSGSVAAPVTVPTDGVRVAFDAQIGGGTGADGMTLTFASPSSAKTLGGAAANLGYSGITGVAVGLVTYKSGTEPSGNFVGIADGGPSGGTPKWVATNAGIPTLQGATTHVVVSIVKTQVTVWVGGVQALQQNVADLPPVADLEFTAGTGGLTDNFVVANVAVSSSSPYPLPPALGGWSTEGSAQLSGGNLNLTTTAATFEAGAVVSATPVPTDGLTVSFDAQIGGGTGANGMTLTFASPSSPTFLGQAGGSLGYSGITGAAVALVNFDQGPDPSANFAGIADGGPVAGAPNWLATSSAIPALQGATTHVVVTVSGTRLTVWVAGVQVLQQSVPDLPPEADLAFTAATGGLTDNFVVQNLTIGRSSDLTPLSSLSSWSLNGTAQSAGTALSLVTSTPISQHGSAVAPGTVATNGLTVGFDAQIGGGTGANGMTLTFADPTSSKVLGSGGANLGYSGITGVAVGLVDFKSGTEPSSNFVGIADGGPVGGIPAWVTTNPAIPTLQGATSHVVVSIVGTQLTVWIGGVQVAQQTVANLPPVARLIFTAATGGLTDNFVVRNVSVSSAVTPSLTNWSVNGNARFTGGDLNLTTPATPFESGSAVSPTAVSTDGLTVAFDAQIGGGTGANGMTLAFASPTTPTLLGQAGGSLGYSGITGVAVGLANYRQGPDPSANFVGIADGGPTGGAPNWLSTSSAIPTLQGATTHVVVSIVGTQMTVTVGGVQVLSQGVADLPPQAYLVFTAATGGLTDNFAVQNVSVTQGAVAPAAAWNLRGTAAVSGTGVSLTTAATTFEAGSASSPTPVSTNGLTVAFDAQIGGGTGANGMTLAFAGPTSPTLLGQGGGSLGYSGITGVAVGLANFQQGPDPSANFAGIADGGPVGGAPNWVATSTGIPTLQDATTHVAVSIVGTLVTVWVDGAQVLQQVVADLPPVATLVFTAATGGLTDNFVVQNVTVTR